jgi:hypothetical protein
MRIAVEEPVAEDHRHPGLGDEVRELAPLLERPLVRMDVDDLRALEPFEREHPRARVAPEHARDVDVRVAGEVAVECGGVPRLETVIQLVTDRPRELVHELARVDEIERTDAFLRDPRSLVEQREIRLDLSRRARALHLHRDLPSVREGRAVDLADRRGRDRLLVELGKQLVEAEAEVLLDDLLDLVERERTDVVLQSAQLRDDVRRQDVRSRRQELAELHERRTELVQHLAQVLAALRRLAVNVHPRAAPREEVGQPVGVEPVAEAVADRDLRDLRETAEVAGRGLDHGLSVARSRGFSWPASGNGPRAVLDQPHPVLELCHAKLQLVPLVARHDAELAEDAVQRRSRALTQAHRIAAPPRRCLVDPRADFLFRHAAALGERLRQLVHPLSRQSDDTDERERELLQGAACGADIRTHGLRSGVRLR